jgi:hypothetical protein
MSLKYTAGCGYSDMQKAENSAFACPEATEADWNMQKSTRPKIDENANRRKVVTSVWKYESDHNFWAGAYSHAEGTAKTKIPLDEYPSVPVNAEIGTPQLQEATKVLRTTS